MAAISAASLTTAKSDLETARTGVAAVATTLGGYDSSSYQLRSNPAEAQLALSEAIKQLDKALATLTGLITIQTTLES